MSFLNPKGVVWVGLLVAMVHVSAFARIVANDVDWDRAEREYIVENETFAKTWSERSDWRGTLCNGHYAYNIAVDGLARSVDFEVKENEQIEVNADLRNVNFGVDGSYRSSYSACLPLKGWLGLSTDRVQITTVVTLGEDESLKDLKLRVTRTQFDTIHLGRHVPAWFERFVTGLVNRAMEKVWASELGEWLNKRLTDFIKEKLPTH